MGRYTRSRSSPWPTLHYIVAHSVSIIGLQATAADQYLERDPARAREHLSTVRRVAHDALTEMRRLTGVLRRTSKRTTSPSPGWAVWPVLWTRRARPVSTSA